MKVCLLGPVVSSRYFGGVASFTEGLAEGFQAIGHEACIVTDYSERKATRRGVPVSAVHHSPGRGNPVVTGKLLRQVRREKAQLLISSLEYGLVNVLLRVFEPQHSRPEVVQYIHALRLPPHRLFNYMYNKALAVAARCADRIVDNSDYTALLSGILLELPVNQVQHLALGYDFIEQLTSLGQKPPKCRGQILYVGRLVPDKRVDYVLKAFALLSAYTVLTIVGDGPERQALEKLAMQLDVADRVIFAGTREPGEVARYYLSADIFISLAPHEAFGIVFLEALAANCKIVCPRTGGQMEVLGEFPERVYTVSATLDEKEIACAVKQALAEPVMMSLATDIVSRFSYDHMAKALLECVTEKAERDFVR